MKVLVLLVLAFAACGSCFPGVPDPIRETPEVSEAKVKHSAAYKAAAAAAEAAPDFDLDGRISAYTGYLSTIDGKLSPLYTDTLPYGAYGVHAPVVGVPPLSGGVVVPGVLPPVVPQPGVPQPGVPYPTVYKYGLPRPYHVPGTYPFPGVDCPYC